jgi:hypothetical protein
MKQLKIFKRLPMLLPAHPGGQGHPSKKLVALIEKEKYVASSDT